MELARTARFYQTAPDELLDRFEDALDNDDTVLASAIRDEFLDQQDFPDRTAKKPPTYLEENPKVGDMVFVNTCNRHARLLAISDDGKKALVKEQFGAYVVDYDKLRRVR